MISPKNKIKKKRITNESKNKRKNKVCAMFSLEEDSRLD